MKRIRILTFCTILTLILCCILPARAESSSDATSGTCGANLTWSITDDVLTISGTGPMYDYGYGIYYVQGGFMGDWVDVPVYYNSAPWGLLSFKHVVVEPGVTSIGSSAFRDFSVEDTDLWYYEDIGYRYQSYFRIESVELPDSITSIGEKAFWGNNHITSFTIGKNITSIGADALSCSFGSYSIYDNGTYIGNSQNPYTILVGTASYSATSLKIHEDTKWIYWLNDSLTELTIPSGVVGISNDAFSSFHSKLQSIQVDPGNAVYSSDAGALLSKDKTELIRVPQALSGSYSIPSTVKIIESEAFYRCEKLTEVIIPSGVTSIGNYAFSFCTNLTNLVIPSSVTSIGTELLKGCTNLTSLTIPFIGPASSVSSQASFGYFFGKPSSTGNASFPGTLKYVTVTGGEISNSAFMNCSTLLTVTLPTTLTRIGANAFCNCTALTTVNGGGSVDRIDKKAFYNCDQLTKLNNVGQFKYVGDQAFYNCRGLTDICISTDPELIGVQAFYNCTSLNYNTSGNAKYIGNDQNPYIVLMCATSKYITSLRINETAQYIYDDAFSGCSSLTSITIPDSITSIGSNAFSLCENLTGVHISDLAAWCHISFGNDFSNPLRYAEKLYLNGELVTNLEIPDNVTGIPQFAFYGCSSFTAVTFPDNITDIGEYAFSGCSSLTSITIPDSVKAIGSSAFSGCSSLVSITIPFVGANETSSYPFGYIFGSTSYTGGTQTQQKYCSSAGSVTNVSYYIPTNLKTVTVTGGSIPYGAFYNCKKLTDITIPENITTINANAFYYCTQLTGITIPASVTSIGEFAFFNCFRMTSVTIPENVTAIGKQAFCSCSGLKTMTIPKDLTEIGERALWKTGCQFRVSQDNPVYSSDEKGVLYNKDKTTLLRVPGQLSGNYTIPDSVQTITQEAFQHCAKLTQVTIAGRVSRIPFGAFEGCSKLTDLTISGSVTDIGYGTFQNCGSLTNLIIGNSVTLIDGYAFSGCAKLTSVTMGNNVTTIAYSAFNGCSSLRNIYLPDSVTSIGQSAFRNCSSLQSISIPSSVTKIDSYAFYNCNSLNHVAYAGTAAQWAEIAIDSNNLQLTTASKLHYNTTFEVVDTCTATSIYCPVCQISVENSTKPNTFHTFAPATCTTPKSCTLCTYTEGTPLGHSMTNATCTTAATCTVCGITGEAARGHSGQWVEILPATCTENGIRARICDVCGITETFTLEAGHRYSTVVTAPTCTAQGYTTHTCSDCGDTIITDYVEAKGHNWSAWIQTKAPTCTAEGVQMRFCNCGIQETEAVEKLLHSYENDVCTICGDMARYDWTLTEDTAVNRILTQDLYVDLSGFDLDGTIVTNGKKLYLTDSSTDGYSCESIGYFNCVDENGDPIVPERICAVGEKRYLTIHTDEGYSFHRFFVGVTHMSLDAEVIGVGYKSAVYGDEMVFGELADTMAFTYRLQLEGYKPVYRYFDRDELTDREPITLRIRNYRVDGYGETPLAAQVSITLNDGTVIEAEEASFSFRWLAEEVSKKHTDYTAEQLALFKAMLQKFTTPKDWEIRNLI